MIEEKIKQRLKHYALSSGLVGRAAQWLFVILKKAKKAISLPQGFYEIYGAKFIARYLSFLYWPVYKLCDLANIRFIMNIAPGVGHTIPEFDNFLHQRNLKEIPPEARYVVVLKKFHIYSDFISLYKHLFFWAISSTLLYDLLLPMLMRYDSLRIDVGVSRMKWHFPFSSQKIVFTKKQPYVFQLSTFDGISQSTRYYARRYKNPSYYPLEDLKISSLPLLERLGIAGRKICLVHLKANVMNGTARMTDPYTYIPALEHLATLGYVNVFIGREAMPRLFNNFGVVNYSQSKTASFKNDFLLFKACDLAIVNGSGVSYFADCMNKPLLYLNSWHIAMPPFNYMSVHVPALVTSRTGSFLKFSDQFKLYLQTTSGDEKFPDEDYIARNASAEEILNATQELLELKSRSQMPLTPLQKAFRKIDEEKGWLSVALSRPSQFFLEQHQGLL